MCHDADGSLALCSVIAKIKDGGYSHLGDFQQVAVNDLFYHSKPRLLAEVMGSQQAEIIVWVDVVQCQDQVD